MKISRLWAAALVGAAAGAIVGVALAGCRAEARSPTHGTGGGGVVGSDLGGSADLAAAADLATAPIDQACPTAPAAGSEVELAPPFAPHYKVYALGKVPGVPNPLGGVVVKAGDPSTLIVAGESERATGALYTIKVQREPCANHIIGFVGTATKLADTPYVDANLVYGPNGLLLYTGWPEFELGQLPPGATAPSRTTDLRTVGMDAMDDQGAGGHGFVPPSLPAAAGQLRVVTWPAGRWYHVAATPSGGLFDVGTLTLAATLPNNPGGFAYVPAGSPGFTKQSIIVAEWNRSDRAMDRVAVYEADANGDPLPATRQEFMTRFPRPWGAYFEPVTGDYLFLTWGDGDDRVYLVQGFVPPPPIF